MAGANGVAAHVLEQFQAPLPHALGYGRTYGAAVVMKAHAIDLDALAIEQKALVGIETGIPNAKDGDYLIHRMFLRVHAGIERIEPRIRQTPRDQAVLPLQSE